MYRITASILAIFVVCNAWGDARLPVVNVGAAGVSARAAFGEPVFKPVASEPSVVPVTKTRVATTQKSNKPTRSVTARAATKTNVGAHVSNGEKIASVADILIPQRPSSNLWAKNDAPLRMPNLSEFSVLRSDFDLPEESLDSSGGTVAMTNQTDNQIATLMELQRRADASVSGRPSQIVSAPIMARTTDNNVSRTDDTTVKLSRLVVPMESQDIVVRSVEKNTSSKIATVRDDMSKMSPSELRRAFRKTFLSENKHLSTFPIDNRFDVASDMSSNIEGFTAVRDLSEAGGIRPLEIKIRFRNEDSALSRDNYTLLTEYASIVVSNPKRAIQIAIPENATASVNGRKLAARRLAIIEQVLRDTGVAEQRVLPVLSSRNDDGFVLRIISNEQFETMTQQQRNMFGDTVNKKTYKSMSW